MAVRSPGREFGKILSRLVTAAWPLAIAMAADQGLAASIMPDAPAVSAKSYILMDAQTGRVLAERDSDRPLPPASLTKIMTSFVAADELAAGRIALDDQVPISVKAWRTGGSKMFVREGTQVALADLLRGIVVQSGNDASVAVAEYIGGDEDGFANMMNAHAAELGLGATRFVNATGLPDDGHYASARDMAALSAALIERFPDHYAMYAERSFEYGDIEQPNRNRLLWRDQSVDGVKTGLTDAAGYCLVASAQRDGMRLVTTVMGAPSNDQRFQDAQKLLAYGFRYFERHKLYDAGEVVATAEVWYGTENFVDANVGRTVRVTVPRGRYEDLEAVVDMPADVDAPIALGQPLGTVRVVLDDDTLAEVPLAAVAAVPAAGLLVRWGDAVRRFFQDLLSVASEPAVYEASGAAEVSGGTEIASD